MAKAVIIAVALMTLFVCTGNSFAQSQSEPTPCTAEWLAANVAPVDWQKVQGPDLTLWIHEVTFRPTSEGTLSFVIGPSTRSMTLFDPTNEIRFSVIYVCA